MRYMFQPNDQNDPSMVIDAQDFPEALNRANLGLSDASMMLIECDDDQATVVAIATELRQATDGKIRHAAVGAFSLKIVRTINAD